MNIRFRISVVLVFAVITLWGLSLPAQEGNETGVVLKPSPDVLKGAENPSPPPDAQKKTSIGNDSMTVNTENFPGDTDFFWIQQIDVNSDGTAESANIIWDDEDKILYYYYEGDFKCRNGKTGSGAALIGVNGKDNPRQKPAGSGFFAVSLDKGECGAAEAGLWGCRFDQSGNPTVCGVVGLDDKYDDIVILKASEE
ncbi:MAG TPA: hypothetical protein VHC46_06625 [Thermodesulfobacteriota bacterium]|nr:hypothetical protein [Thermodesulfobacteriota bacterium]